MRMMLQKQDGELINSEWKPKTLTIETKKMKWKQIKKIRAFSFQKLGIITKSIRNINN